jgi:putative ABC transport system ATP-binding protein
VLKLVRRDGRDPAVVWVLSNTALSSLFDRVLVFDRGLLVEEGTHAALVENNGIFKELVSS